MVLKGMDVVQHKTSTITEDRAMSSARKRVAAYAAPFCESGGRDSNPWCSFTRTPV